MNSPSRRDIRRARRNLDRHRTPLWFKLWFAFCAVVGLTVLGVGVWLALAAIAWLERQP